MACFYVAVKTVIAGIESPSFEPTDVSFNEVILTHLVPAAGPRYPFSRFLPEPFGVLDGALVETLVLVDRSNMSLIDWKVTLFWAINLGHTLKYTRVA